MNTSRVFTFFWHSQYMYFNVILSWFTGGAQKSPFWVFRAMEPLLFFLFQVHHTWSQHVGTILRIHILPRKAESICWKLDFFVVVVVVCVFFLLLIMTTLKGEWVFSFSFWLNLEIGEVYIFFLPFLASCLLKRLGYISWK